MKPRQLIAFAILMVPICGALLWHLSNNGLPNDDAANYAVTALKVAREFKQGLWAGISAVLNIRGWRPTAFSAFSVPFLLLTGGNVVAACAATLLSIYVALTFYSYRLVRLFSTDPLVAASTTAAVVTMPVIISYSFVFFSELAWILFSVAFVYHFIRSGPLRNSSHALGAGFYGGLMGTVRPVESLVILAVLFVFLVFPEFRARRLAIKSSLIALAVFFTPVTLLLGSAWFKGITRLEIWGATIASLVLATMLIRRLNSAVVFFLGMLTVVTCFWWGGFMPGLMAWANEASSYSVVARVTEMSSVYEIAQTLLRQARDYGQVQLGVVLCIGILLVRTAVMSRNRNREHKTPREEITNQAWLLLYASATLLLLFVAAYSLGGSDRRRSLVALTLLVLSILAIAATRSRLALAGILCLTAIQFVVIGSALSGAPVWADSNGLGIPAPHRASDGNVEAARELAKHVRKESYVTVYTLALFSPADRVYEPNALKLALLQGNYGFDSGYFWDSEPYDGTLIRLYQSGFKYLLLDSLSTVDQSVSRDPYAHLTVDLLRRVRAGGAENPRLRLITQFQLGEREHMLFRILPSDSASYYSNLAAEWNGSRAVANEQQNGFPYSNLNDGTGAPWGSREGKSDVYAGVVLPSPVAIHTLQLRLMTPEGRAHLREIRIVAADREDNTGAGWQFVRARVKGTKEFSNLITVPPYPDNTVVEIELDPKDSKWRPHLIWGFACLRSRGDVPNYVTVGSGVYVRELMVQ